MFAEMLANTENSFFPTVGIYNFWIFFVLFVNSEWIRWAYMMSGECYIKLVSKFDSEKNYFYKQYFFIFNTNSWKHLWYIRFIKNDDKIYRIYNNYFNVFKTMVIILRTFYWWLFFFYLLLYFYYVLENIKKENIHTFYICSIKQFK